MLKVATYSAAAMFSLCASAVAGDTAPLSCAGGIAPLVPTKSVATEIYRAVVEGQHAQIDRKNILVVNDEGDHWVVFQYPAHVPRDTVVAGGGALELTVNKCDGSLGVSYAR